MEPTRHKRKQVLTEGPISPAFIAEAIAKHSSQTGIGAHAIFLGQVRSDVIDGKSVQAITYSAYPEMAEDAFHEIREKAFARFSLTCMHIYHSLGTVKSGEISLFVFVSSVHRADAFAACKEIVDAIKAEVPVWGKELLEDGTHVWKKNTP